LVFPSGYAANLGVFHALAGPRSHVFADALAHASLFDGARAVHARIRVYATATSTTWNTCSGQRRRAAAV
jgi:8-amino-7-oxononanoate synthase